MTFEIVIKSLRFETPLKQKKRVLTFGKLYQSQKCKDTFVNQPHPSKIAKIEAFHVFLKKKYEKI